MVAQSEWHDGMIRDLFKTKSNFRKQRRAMNAVYNGRSAFMKAKGLNAVSVKPVWDRLPGIEKERWAEIAHQLNEETSK